MKFNLKKSVAGMLVMLTLIPTLAFAENENSGKFRNGEEGKERGKSAMNFCARISDISSRTAEQITKIEEKQAKSQSERLGKLERKQGEVDEKRFKNRTEADGKRLGNWERMGGKAKTDAQKAAVEAYKTAIQSAVSARRTAVDAAVKAYRDGLALIMSTNSGTLTSAIATFKASVNAAVAKAQVDCTAGVDSNTVKTAFNLAVKDAREALKNARKSIDKSAEVQALKKTREDAINAAITAFKSATEKARADLKIALGVN